MNVLKNICFVCLTDSEKNLMTVLHNIEDEIFLHVKYALPELEILGSELPVYICSSCSKTLSFFCTFKKQCLENYSQWKHYKKILQGTNNTQKQNELQVRVINCESLIKQVNIKEDNEDKIFNDYQIKINDDIPMIKQDPELHIISNIKEENEDDFLSSELPNSVQNNIEEESISSKIDDDEPEECPSRQCLKRSKLSKLEKVENAKSTLLSAKSSQRYLKAYKLFCNWKETNDITDTDERVLLAYFEDQYQNSKPTCLWSYYTMIRSCLLIHEKVDIKRYSELNQYLRRKTAGFKSKKSKVLSHADIIKFLEEADDDNFLLLKVILILGIFGGCRREELINITTDDMTDSGTFIKICIPNRSFIIPNDTSMIIRKYMSLRPADVSNKRFLIGYRKKKCTAQAVGVHTVGNAPRKIAEYLGLPDANAYTGHCFRHSSAILLAEGAGNLGVLMHHGG